ncbi:MAG: chalcone isomerase family protein [Bdellovibrio sp.]|nr:chalcone isomerase family protein [Bdellovibrio sp.]
MKSTTKPYLLMTVILAALSFSNLAYAKKDKNSKMTKPPTAQENAAAQAAAAPVADAKPVSYQINTVEGNEKFEDSSMAKSRTLITDGKSTDLKSVNFGLRKKAVFGLVPVRVYVAQFFAANPEKLIKTEDGFAGSLQAAGPVQLRLSFLRDLPGPKIAESFKEGLEANKINIKNLSPELTQTMNIVSSISEFKKGESFSITGSWTDTTSTLILESSTEIKVITGTHELANHIFSIWFGKPADGKLADLKKALIK